ncbi:hypothetical protein F751_0022 [Auxenochlorella protothecoides]|uniref:Uncharacterized protein n=1 Tax=Auxenochlorella protothecoides TaxID=3075 RepID=A0A087S9H5_AUXPR|nr:hypothetical protein F751_0022 [Auxenochlorella protothecoides]KFM22379.1 hypothetical protein F751_0022 [Auxenochlorella protothecoides]
MHDTSRLAADQHIQCHGLILLPLTLHYEAELHFLPSQGTRSAWLPARSQMRHTTITGRKA